ncbi:hypothetical protein ACQR2B_09585 [Bradyrhizobium oligotrophicum]|uniref:hypothetical protein n=1 Tax=Bradyrhizobium TaxID=374 RepID=UPI0028EF1776|nr:MULTISPECIES: hypothetical protein [unclassified Bradyrhizobium]
MSAVDMSSSPWEGPICPQNVDDNHHLLAKMMFVIYIFELREIYFGKKPGAEGGEQAGDRELGR